MTRSDTAQESAGLMAEIAAGREAALTRLIALHGRDVALFAGRMLGHAADGDEVAQDTFLRVWRMAGRYDPARGSVTTWIYRIAVNLCIDRQRRNRFWRVFRRADVADMADALADDAPDALTTLAGKQQLRAVRAGIAALPDRQRSAIMLAAVAGLDTDEIAATMGTSRGAVEQLLVRARRSLRRDVGDDDA